MTTFTTEDRKLVELHVKTFPTQQCQLTHPITYKPQETPEQTKSIVQYRIEDSSEDLDN